jgi:thiamine kinase-like enzyme
MLANYESKNQLKDKLNSLHFFEGNITIEDLKGGMSYATYLISDKKNKFVAKIGKSLVDFRDNPLHQIEANKAANIANITPKMIYSEEGILIFEFIKSKILTAKEIRQEDILKKVISLIKIVHEEVNNYFNGPTSTSWYFSSITDSIKILKNKKSSYSKKLDKFIEDYKIIKKALGFHKVVFTHNDLVGNNILNDGKKLWLIDWEFSGYNFAILDLANLSKNNQFNEEEDNFMLSEYFKNTISLSLRYNFQALKCAALLREIMWSLRAEMKSKKDFDYKSYTDKIFTRYTKQLNYFKILNI